MKLLIQSLFFLVLAGISGSNVVAWHNNHMPLLSQMDEMEVVVEQEEVLQEESDSSDEGFNVGGDDPPEQLTVPSKALFYLHQANTVLPGSAASFRQYRVNLLNSFRAPAFFILFHSYQGYLS